jgi:carbon-monoxide dehydrogenase large subunit
MLHAAFVRSPFPHARITNLDVSAAREAPGVVAVYTGTEMQAQAVPFKVAMAGVARVPDMYPLPLDKVRLVGDLVAMVVARSRYEAEDGCELVEVDYEPLPAVATMDQALDPGSAPIWEELGDNIIARSETSSYGDVDAAFAEADRVFEMTLDQHRIANVPMETRGAVADYDAGTGDLNFHSATQGGNGLRMLMAETLNFPMEKIRVLTGDVGGSFGLKSGISREDLCLAVASRALQRPVKWIEDRNEHMLASGHAREERVTLQAAVNNDGTILGINPVPRRRLLGADQAPSARPVQGEGVHLQVHGGGHQQGRVLRLPGPVGDGDLDPGADDRHHRPRAGHRRRRDPAAQHG